NILLLAVAGIIFLRLKSVLGRRTGPERPHPHPYAAPEGGGPRDSNVITLPRTEVRPPASRPAGPSIDERWASLPAERAAGGPLREIAAADPAFDAGLFLSGAKVAYETIVGAYAHGDRETLRNLLSAEVYDSFNAVIAERESRGETAEFSFV